MSPPVVVPAALRAGMTAAHGPAGAASCGRLPDLVAGYAARWDVPMGAALPRLVPLGGTGG